MNLSEICQTFYSEFIARIPRLFASWLAISLYILTSVYFENKNNNLNRSRSLRFITFTTDNYFYSLTVTFCKKRVFFYFGGRFFWTSGIYNGDNENYVCVNYVRTTVMCKLCMYNSFSNTDILPSSSLSGKLHLVSISCYRARVSHHCQTWTTDYSSVSEGESFPRCNIIWWHHSIPQDFSS